MNKEQRILATNVAACEQRIGKLTYSVNKVRPPFPLAEAQLEHLTDEQEESIDALILRYSQTVAMIQDHLFRGIAYVEQEDISDKSNRDKTLLMEKLGAIRSAEEFGTAAVLRNKFAHHYPEQAAERLERLNLIIEEADFVISTFDDIQHYLKRKNILVS